MTVKSLSYLVENCLLNEFNTFELSDEGPLTVSGLEGSSLSGLIAAQYLKTKEVRPQALVVMQDQKSAEMLLEDLKAWLPQVPLNLFPSLDLKPYEWRKPFGRIIEQRLQCFNSLLDKKSCLTVTTAKAFLQKLNPPKFFRREIITLEKNQEIDLEDLRETLVHMGFIEESIVEDMGQFSIRGGIIDIYPYLVENPVRMELWGDEIESIREFDIFSQRSTQPLDKFQILPVDECCYTENELEEGLLKISHLFQDETHFDSEIFRHTQKKDRTGIYWQKSFFSAEACSLIDFFSTEPLVISEEQGNSKIQTYLVEIKEAWLEANKNEKLISEPSDLFFNEKEFKNLTARKYSLIISTLSTELTGYHTFNLSAQIKGGGSLNSVNNVLEDLTNSGYSIFLLSEHQGKAERLRKLSEDMAITDVLVGSLACGFIQHTDKLAVFTDHQIFNQASRGAQSKKFKGGGISIQNFEALTRGDTIVHQDYGLGIFVGIKRVKIERHAVDCILLQYKAGDKLTIPVADLKKIQKHISKEGSEPALSKLGGKAWEQLKARTKKSIIVLAKDLIELYAKRSAIKGFAYSADTNMQNEFEEGFSYITTPDQERAIQDVKKDMQNAKPMDRLVCGDVGFGKTEVAMRAIFKAVVDQKQVAFVAPTTLLVSQHYHTCLDRFSNWPVRFEFLNRFKSRSEENVIKRDVADGKIDVLIGTHRIFSNDIKFKDLGLMILDEEQKFGVNQKEKLKTTRNDIDVLSLSATPIPRSLYMSMVGARNFSVILTPPRNRLPIDTRVIKHDQKTIKEAIERELERGGQCFIVNDRIIDLAELANEMEELVPLARIAVAHGQMNEKDLENIMVAFIGRQYDILISTSIIESGIDLPNVNTIIINNAQSFGLSQLFQMRGRVGRSSTKAFCLLIAPPEEKFTDVSKKRLYSLQKFTELGSGYQLAMRDLELRGAGNILGTKQSGHITAVGFDTYCKLLGEAVLELQNKKEIPLPGTEIEFPGNAYLPEEYINDGLQRISLYQKISHAEKIEDIDELEKELDDRFGPVPESAITLLDIARIKILGQKIGFQKIKFDKQRLLLIYSEFFQPPPGDLDGIMSTFSMPIRFINETPLQISAPFDSLEPQKQIKVSIKELLKLEQLKGSKVTESEVQGV